MNYKTNILILLAYDSYYEDNNYKTDYTESAAREWAENQVTSLTNEEIDSWFEIIQKNEASMGISYYPEYSICLV